MGDIRFLEPYRKVRNAETAAAVIPTLDDDDVVSALAAASVERDTYLANVLATELHNRLAQRGRLERALQATEERLRRVLAAAPLFIAATDREGVITLYQGRALTDAGMAPGILEGRSAFEAFDHRPDALAALRRALAGEEVEIHRHNESHSYIVRYAPLLDAAGAVDGAIVVSTDVTEQARMAERALRESEERYRLITSVTQDAAWDRNLETGEVWWSSGFFSLFGQLPRAPESLLDAWRRRIHPEDRERVLADVDAALEGDADRWEGEYRFLRGDGSMARVHDRARILRDADGRPVRMVGAMRDVTAARSSE